MDQLPDAAAFAVTLSVFDEHMSEMAAFAAACDAYGITEEQGYDLLAMASLGEDFE